ncbi:MAG TPA: COX15/CtaA family protein [Terriglobales bacterium]|nr:COX15/CtaA family protein [Terriglobales bacterium]
MKSESTLYNPWHHRVAIFIASLTFVVIVAGALVTSEDAGLSVPDWPTSYGHILRLPPWVGGIVYEHSHRMIASVTGILTTLIAFWTLFVDGRRWMKILGFAALGTIVVQGILGGVTVLNFLPPAVSTAHAAVGQTFFCIAVAIAVFTGRKWVEEVPSPVVDDGHPKVLVLCAYSLGLLYVQLVFGGMFRHHGMSWWPHVVNSVTVALCLTWTGVRALTTFPRVRTIRRAAALLLFTLVVQLLLGFMAFLTRIAWPGTEASNSMVVSTVAHTSVGALLLAITAVLTIQVWRHAAVTQKREIPEGRTVAV